MNGSNSNTSGKDVARIGYWPKHILPRVKAVLSDVLANIANLETGELKAAVVDFEGSTGTDRIDDVVMEEIARRMKVFFETGALQNLVLAPEAPSDTTKIWGQTDPITGVLVGQIKRWDSAQQKWVSTVEGLEPYTPPRTYREIKSVNAGNSTVNIDFPTMERKDYDVNIVASTWNGSGYGLPPASFPGANGYCIVNKTETQLTLAFYAVPTGGLSYEITLRNQE